MAVPKFAPAPQGVSVKKKGDRVLLSGRLTIGQKFEGIGAIFMRLQPIHLFLNRLLTCRVFFNVLYSV